MNYNEILVFIHIPKNAGTFIKYLIKNINNPRFISFNELNLNEKVEYKKLLIHSNPMELSVVKQYTKYKTFCVLRDPIERIVSCYKWILSEYEDDKKRKVPERRRRINTKTHSYILNRGISFNEFVKLIPDILNNTKPGYNNLKWHLEHQYKQIEGVDHIILIKNLNEELPKLLELYNIEYNKEDFELEINKTNNNKIDIDEESKKIIETIYKEDFLIFNTRSIISNIS